jgi:hypothetical protein
MIQYVNENGTTITVNSPTLPWTTSFTANSGSFISLRAKGTMTNATTDNVRMTATCLTVGSTQSFDKTYSTNTAYDQTYSLTLK